MTGAAVGFGVIVRSADLLLTAVATVAMASSDDAAADSGRGVSLDYFLGLATHLLDEDLIGRLNIGVPFCSHRCGDGESRDRVWLTGQEEEGCLLCAGINLVLLPFQRHQLELRENKSCEQRRPKEREIIAVKCHYRPRIRRLQGIDPRRSGSASNAQPPAIGPGVSRMSEIKSQKKSKNNALP